MCVVGVVGLLGDFLGLLALRLSNQLHQINSKNTLTKTFVFAFWVGGGVLINFAEVKKYKI